MTPFRVEVPDADLEDLRARLRRTRWPEPETVTGWEQGVPLAYLRDLCAYWADGYSWRAAEARLNSFAQFRTELDGLGVHFLHVRSPHEGALPLLMTHGWPGSVLEFLDVLGPLTDPTAHGGAAADAFHVVCPSLPGYGFSDRPAEPGWGVERIADAWITLMSRLGYQRYAAQGHDWGTSISTLVAQRDPRHVTGIHLVPPLAPPDPATFDDLTEGERVALAALEHAKEWEDGYSVQQATRPQTIGYGLVDSPAALCAWLVEKFRSWSDRESALGRDESPDDPESVISRDELLDNVTLYWLTGTGASAARLYWESIRRIGEWMTESTGETVDVPTGCSVFPGEVPRPSRRWAARRYTDIRYWHEPARGGHFAALEQPGLFVDEVRACFRALGR
ncbi:epoxide hydrolase family protein [Nonomuraea cavernae]|uniref:epoxide hydrolase family protein n=1 Tax=Nonomuraea cavernae TaxID=2045107 RepID=UPI0027DF09CF|nr:epoxide hydrolase [Nonomuraea cavernae]